MSPAKKSTTKRTATKPPAKRASAKPAAKKRAPKSAPYEKGKWAAAFTPREPGEVRYWLVKSEPDSFSIDDLVRAPNRTTSWDGVRNSAARNFLRDGLKVGDLAFFYHSMTEPQAIVGIVEIVREGYPDSTAFDPKHPQYDPGSMKETPAWYMVDVRLVEKWARPVTLGEINARRELAAMALLRVGRLSVVPVAPKEWNAIVAMSKVTAK
jgi:predicted RNA-binding protein with PUA-like domain